jgi:hypothetical protein
MQRPEPAANLQILRSAYGSGNVLQVAPSQLMVSMDSVDGGIAGARDPHGATGPFRLSGLQHFRSSATASEAECLADVPEWQAQTQANERSKIFVALCRGFVNAWLLASRPVAALPGPPTTVDAAYR